MKRAAISLIATAVLAAVLTPPSTALEPSAPTFEHLDPGGRPDLRERLPVNIVFVGYDRRDVDKETFLGMLAERYRPIVRSRAFYGIQDKLGITIDYRYRAKFTRQKYEDRLFTQLGQLAQPAPLTLFQEEYNQQDGNVLDVPDNHHIDAPTVERWLADNPPPRVNTRRNTVYLINWYGRPDFKFHVYTKTDEPDPDTGYNFGAERDSRKLVAWGGTTADDEESGLGSTRRVWFHDLSAGPEGWAGSYNITDEDLDGDGGPDYRIPPAWEYGKGAYRPLERLTGDLARLTRYVALDLLFTTSPLYPVELPTDRPPQTIDIDSNVYEGWPGVDASKSLISGDVLMWELRELLDRDEVSYDSQDLPFTGHAERCYLRFLAEERCYPKLGYPPFANLFLQNTFQLARTQDDQGLVDYELPVFSYAVGKGLAAPLLGFADDNYRNGTQSYVFAFVSPELVEEGYGLTTTLIHEVGHHIGLSHPQDGYDSATGVDFGPSGKYYFAWLGSQVNSMMSYIDLNWDFSQFDRDNMDRFKAEAYIEAANTLAGEALNAESPELALNELQLADEYIARAETAFSRHRYSASWSWAERAYEAAVDGALEAGVDVDEVMRLTLRIGQAARQAGELHEPGEFIDEVDEGPRGQP